MVEATKEMPAEAQAPAQAPAPKAPKKEVGMCEHVDDLATYCKNCDLAMCNDCYFDNHGKCGKGMTLKQAATLQINAFKEVLTETNEEHTLCSSMKTTVQQQEGILEEVVKKVDHQYEQLKNIVDEQRKEAFNVIKNLESIKEYQPPPKDFTAGTLGQMDAYIADINS
jgi:hypothetical protein